MALSSLLSTPPMKDWTFAALLCPPLKCSSCRSKKMESLDQLTQSLSHQQEQSPGRKASQERCWLTALPLNASLSSHPRARHAFLWLMDPRYGRPILAFLKSAAQEMSSWTLRALFLSNFQRIGENHVLLLMWLYRTTREVSSTRRRRLISSTRETSPWTPRVSSCLFTTSSMIPNKAV